MRRQVGLAAFVVALLAVASSCGGGGSGAKPTSTPSVSPASTNTNTGSGEAVAADACRLLTATDLHTVLHVDFSTGVPSGDNGLFGTTCAFATTDQASHVNVVRYQPVRDLITNTRKIDPSATKLTGLGDDSVYQGNAAAQLTVAVGNVGFVVSVVMNPEPDQAGMEALAKIIISRIR